MSLLYKPLKTLTDDRNWRTTLAVDSIIETLKEAGLSGFEEDFKANFTKREKRIQLIEHKIQLTHYREGEEFPVYEEKNNIQSEINSPKSI